MANLARINHNDRLINPFPGLLDNVFGNSWHTLRTPAYETFKLDIKEDSDTYTIEAELPGVKKDNINLMLNDGRLTISVEAKEIPEEERHKLIHKERRYTYMERAVYLEDAATDGTFATLEHGVLYITVPKDKNGANSRKIEIV